MKRQRYLSTQAGFSIVEMLIAIGVLAGAMLVCLYFTSSQTSSLTQIQTSSVRDRIISGVRSLAANPAALRNSMRAADGTGPVNPQLLACAGGNPVGACANGVTSPLTLYSPVLSIASDGSVMGQIITAPSNSNISVRFNIWGAPCAPDDKACPLLVYTSFSAICGPKATASALTAPVDPSQLLPQSTCTVASVVNVNYTVKIDPDALAANPALAAIGNSVSGSVATSVKLISGNAPQ